MKLTNTSAIGKMSTDDDAVLPNDVRAADMVAVKAALFERRTSKTLNTLNLSHCDFTDTRLFQSLLQLIQDDTYLVPPQLNLSFAKFASKADFAELLSILQVNKSVIDLNLSTSLCSQYIAADGSLSRLLRSNKTLRKLNLSGHTLGMDGIQDLIEGLRDTSSSLTELRVYSCALNDASASLLLQNAANLEVLDLGANRLSSDFLNTSVATLLARSTNLRSLALDHSSSMFASNDIQQFLTALANNRSCEELSLRYCCLGEELGEALLQTLVTNTTLRTLDMEFSGFGLRDKGNEILLKYISQMKALQQLKILTVYPPELVPDLMKALKENSSLLSFSPTFKHRGYLECKRNVQSILERNRLLSRVQPLLVSPPSTPVTLGVDVFSAAILPGAMAQLLQTNNGSAAAFLVMQKWIGECI